MNISDIQPLDKLMNELGVSNAQLVEASTEQLSFKMVQKGRRGKRLTPNIQEKILNALLKVKPDLQVRRRDLFRYELNPETLDGLKKAQAKMAKGKLDYPQYVDLLAAAGLTRYSVEVAGHRVTYYGAAGEALVEEHGAIGSAGLGAYDEKRLKGCILAAQQRKIDYPTFLQRIHESGIVSYEANLRERKIVYKGEVHAYREDIPAADAVSEPKPKPVKKAPAKAKAEPEKPAKPRKSHRKKPGVKRTTTKARVAARKRFFTKQRKKRR